MAQCDCGWQLKEPDKLCTRCAALPTLGLEHRASRNEIRDAYRVMVKVWHPDRFSNDVKLRSKAEEKLKEVNAAFQHLNSSADGPPARAASATKKPEAKTQAQKPYWTSKTSTRTYQWYSTSAGETPRSNASAQEPPGKDVSASGFPYAAPPQSNGNARTQSPTPEAKRQINAAFQHLNSSADTPPARATSATKKPEAKAEAQKPYETAKTSTRITQSSSASAGETARPNASAQEPPRMDASGSGFPNAARPQSNGNARPQSQSPGANRPINKGAPSALFSLRRIPYLLVLALSVAFTRMWVDAGKISTTAQDWIMNQYYIQARKNTLRQEQSAPTKAENSVVAPSSSPSSPKQDLHLPQKRSNTTAVSEPLRSDARLPVPRSEALLNYASRRERRGRLNQHGDCRTSPPQDAGTVQPRPHGSQAHSDGNRCQ
jgi:hypothetical protein